MTLMDQSDVIDWTARAMGGRIDTPLDSRLVLRRMILRYASTASPVSRRELVSAVSNSLTPLVREHEQLAGKADIQITDMIITGDLLETVVTDEADGRRKTLIYLAPPRYIWLTEDWLALLGGLPDERSMITRDLDERITYRGSLRCIAKVGDEDLGALLTNLGVGELSVEAWAGIPTAESSSEHVKRFDNRLIGAPPAMMTDGIRVINSDRPIDHYVNRWSEMEDLSGRFVGRRSQDYGPDAWCYAELVNGTANRFIDIPRRGSLSPFDIAIRLQAALDQEQGHPQQVGIDVTRDENVLLEFDGPLPRWAERRWLGIGQKTHAGNGLFAYEFPMNVGDAQGIFLRTMLWMTQK
jgi:hypothetical protein